MPQRKARAHNAAIPKTGTVGRNNPDHADTGGASLSQSRSASHYLFLACHTVVVPVCDVADVAWNEFQCDDTAILAETWQGGYFKH